MLITKIIYGFYKVLFNWIAYAKRTFVMPFRFWWKRACTMHRFRGVSRLACGFLGTFLITIAVGCAPMQEVLRQQEECFDANVKLVAISDKKFTKQIPETEEINEIINNYLQMQNAPPGCAVGIVLDNKILFLKGYGLADITSQTQYTYATMQGIGSISKTITALSIMKLVEQGQISLDDRVNWHLNFPHFNLLTVTIRDLLSHLSGLPTFPEWDESIDTEEELQMAYPGFIHPGINPRFVQQSYNETERVPLLSNTGIYSNTGYTLLGAVIDNVTTRTDFTGRRGYEAYTWFNVALKGGIISGPIMSSMCLDTYWREDDILNLATGYRQDGVTVFPNRENPDGGPGGWRGPAGGWAMTIGDLCRLMIGINTNTFVTPELKLEMMAPNVRPQNGGEATWGLGVWKIKNLGRQTFMHAGNIDGFTARYTFWPNEGIGVALMCNRDRAGRFRQITNSIAALFLNSSDSEGNRERSTDDHRDENQEAKRIVELIIAQAKEQSGMGKPKTQILAGTDQGRLIQQSVKVGNIGKAIDLARSLIQELQLNRAEPSQISGGLNETP